MRQKMAAYKGARSAACRAESRLRAVCEDSDRMRRLEDLRNDDWLAKLFKAASQLTSPAEVGGGGAAAARERATLDARLT